MTRVMEHDLAKESKQSRTKVKTGKFRGDEAKAIKRRTTLRHEETEEEDTEDEEDGTGEDSDSDRAEGSPKGFKRARANTVGDSRPSGDQSNKNEVGKSEIRVKTLPRDADGYVPGSIVRIKLENFLTYDFVEFHPGPQLNMIIGPNGTGKSSVACAICIGLNFPPATLGRADQLNQFVKKGKHEGYTEIELKGKKGKPNLVVRRMLQSNSKNSSFFLNGVSTSGRDVTNKVADLNVQVSNLCSFLPQDKVSQFAAMSSQQLLRETQKAAGDPNLIPWHDTLIASGQELKKLQTGIETEKTEVENLKARNGAIERDVLRYLEKEKIQTEINLTNVLLPVAMYSQDRKRFMAARDKQRSLHTKVKKLRDRNAPAHALLNDYVASMKECESQHSSARRATEVVITQMKKKWKEIDAFDVHIDKANTELDGLVKDEEHRVERLKNIQNELTKSKENLESCAKPESEDDIRSAANALRNERNPIIQRRQIANDQMAAVIQKQAEVRNARTNAENGLRRLNDVNEQKLQKLGKMNKNTLDTVIWLRQNQHRFKFPIIEPMFLSCQITDARYVAAVEACLSFNQILTFVPQCHEDYNLLNKLIQDDKVLGHPTHIYNWYRDTAEVPPPLTEDELRAHGFDGYALDFIKYEKPMARFLRTELMLHRAALAIKNPRSVNPVEAQKAFADAGGGNFIIGNNLQQVSRSSYGRRAIQNLTRDIKQASWFVGTTIDVEEQNRLQGILQDLEVQSTEHSEEHAAVKTILEEISKEDTEFSHRTAELRRRQEAVQLAIKRRVSLESNITRYEKEIRELRKRPSLETAKKQIKGKLLQHAKNRLTCVRQYNTLVRDVIDAQKHSAHIGLKFLQVVANKKALEDLCEKKDAKFQEALRDFKRADEEYIKLKVISKDALVKVRGILDGMDEDNPTKIRYYAIDKARTAYEKQVEAAKQSGREPPSADGVDLRTADELTAALEQLEADLDLAYNGNRDVVVQYEERKEKIASLERSLETRAKQEQKMEKTIASVKDKWKPALDRLVASIGKKFSGAFDRIGCAGEVRIGENPDFDKWTIDILVKFREADKLQLLTAQRQSGGERSLTTVLYLMSLTEEARAPFSLVDEINQGMDQRYERVVHNNLVDVTCNGDSAQYFLITPKLLPDLKYHERMKILCVANGEWLPDEPGVGKMMSLIDGYVQRRATAASNN